MKNLEQLGDLDRQTRGLEFASLVRCLMLGRGEMQDIQAVARRNGAPQRVRDVVEKATPGIGGTGDWGIEIQGYRLLVSAFMDQLKWSSVFYRLLPDMIRLPFNTIIGAVMGGSSAGLVTAGAGIPVVKLDVLQAEQLERQKAGAILVATEQLLQSGVGVEGLLSRNLRALVSNAVDTAFMDILEAGAPTSAATAAPETDLETMRASVAPTDESRLFWIAAPATAALLAGLTASGSYRYPGVTWTGGELKGAPLLVSDQVDAGDLALVDAARVSANADPIELNASRHSLIQAVDNPGVGSPVGVGIGADTLISLWQQNCRAVRCIAYFGAEKARYNAVYILTGVAWAST